MSRHIVELRVEHSRSDMAAVAVRTPLREGDSGPEVALLQAWLNATFPLYSRIDLGPQRYGPETVAVIAEFQRRAAVTGADADRRIIGPRTWAALERHGYVRKLEHTGQLGQWVPVVDISQHQGAVNFAVMRSRGVAGVIIRATHGTTVDNRLAD